MQPENRITWKIEGKRWSGGRKELVESASREILHMQGALTQMNVQLH